jgi:uncharacterized protein
LILLDTGPIVAFFDASDHYHALCLESLKKIDKPLITTWPVLTEAFYLLGFSWKAQDNLWEFIQRGGMDVAHIDPAMGVKCRELMAKYRDLPMDFADGSLVALADAKDLQQVFTLDHKDFKIYRLKSRKKFELIPSRL